MCMRHFSTIYFARFAILVYRGVYILVLIPYALPKSTACLELVHSKIAMTCPSQADHVKFLSSAFRSAVSRVDTHSCRV